MIFWSYDLHIFLCWLGEATFLCGPLNVVYCVVHGGGGDMRANDIMCSDSDMGWVCSMLSVYRRNSHCVAMRRQDGGSYSVLFELLMRFYVPLLRGGYI